MKVHNVIPTVLVKKSYFEPVLPDDVAALEKRSPGFMSELLLLPDAQRDAGRLSGLAELDLIDQGMPVRYPATSRAIAMALGAIGGGAIGGIAGNKLAPETNPLGVGLGAAGGAVIGAFIDTMRRRKQKKLILQQLKENRGIDYNLGGPDSIKVGNPLAQLVAGVHQQGRADALDFAAGKRKFEGNPNMQAMDILSKIPYAGSVMQLPLMAGQSINYQKARDRILDHNEESENYQNNINKQK